VAGDREDFIALTDPEVAADRELEVLPSAPASLPEPQKKRGGEPPLAADLEPVPPRRRPAGSALRASLRRDPKTGWTGLALIEEDVPGKRIAAVDGAPRAPQADPRCRASACRRHPRAGSGHRAPTMIPGAGMDLYLHVPGSSLRASFAPEDFRLRQL
jgi:hypothetical protein